MEFKLDRGPQDLSRLERIKPSQRKDMFFELSFFESVVGSRPNYLDALKCLAEIYTALGFYVAGLKIDNRICELEIDNCVSFYNLASSHALLGNKDIAINTLEKAIKMGYNEIDQILADSDLSSLFSDSRFNKLISKDDIK